MSRSASDALPHGSPTRLWPGHCTSRWLLALAICCTAAWPTAAGQEVPQFAPCEALLATEPLERESADCFFDAADTSGLYEVAAQRLEHLLRLAEASPWQAYALGQVRWAGRLEGAEEAYALAARMHLERGQAEQALNAILQRSRFLIEMVGEAPAVARALHEARQLAQAEGLDDLALRVVELKARWQLGGDMGEVYQLATALGLELDGPERQRDLYTALSTRTEAAIELGRFADARDAAEELLAMALELGGQRREINARFALARALASLDPHSEERRQQAVEVLEQTLEMARDRPFMEPKLLLQLARMESSSRRERLSRCVEITDPDSLEGTLCRGELALLTAAETPGGTGELDRAFLLAMLDADDPWLFVFGWDVLLRWSEANLGPGADAIAAGVLELVRAIRLSQLIDVDQALMLDTWSEPFYRISGQWLDRAQHGEEQYLALGFQVMEAMRAQVLREAVAAPSPGFGSDAGVPRAELAELLRTVARIRLQLDLAAAAGEPPERVQELETSWRQARARWEVALGALPRPDTALASLTETVGDLPGVSASPQGAGDAIPDEVPDAFNSDPVPSKVMPSKVMPSNRVPGAFEDDALAPSVLSTSGSRLGTAAVEMAAVQSTLAEDEAMLLFQLGSERTLGIGGGGSWLLVLSGSSASLHALPLVEELQTALLNMLGFLDAQREPPENLWNQVYEQLFAAGLETLAAGVERLIIVPDGALHLLPLAALRGRDGIMLATRYQLSISPSAALWLHWRQNPAPVAGSGPLVFADPEMAPVGNDVAPVSATGSTVAAWMQGQRSRLGPLPQARREGRIALRWGGAGGRLLLDDEASESALLASDLTQHSLLHLAAHAVVEGEPGGLSGVLLAGGQGEDGLLTPTEIARLPLTGQVVVLAACDSAGGSVLRGEGVMSLARAFLAAGASAVVGSQRRLEDRESAQLFSTFYRHLASGASAAAALREAQLEEIELGSPSTSWAQVVLLGDGERIPWPQAGRGKLLGLLMFLALMAALVTILVLALRHLRRRAHSPSHP